MKPMRILAAGFAAAVLSFGAGAAEEIRETCKPQSIVRFAAALDSAAGAFEQTARTRSGKAVSSGGMFWYQRPMKMRWLTEYPAKTELWTDGKSYWFWDEDLGEASNGALGSGSMPVLDLLGDPKGFERSWKTEANPVSGGICSFRLSRKDAQAGSPQKAGPSEMEAGLAGDKLLWLAYEDGMGQTVRIEFSSFERGGKADPALFEAPGAKVRKGILR